MTDVSQQIRAAAETVMRLVNDWTYERTVSSDELSAIVTLARHAYQTSRYAEPYPTPEDS